MPRKRKGYVPRVGSAMKKTRKGAKYVPKVGSAMGRRRRLKKEMKSIHQLNYNALMELAKKEAKHKCDLMYPPNSEYWKSVRQIEEPRLVLKKYKERVAR